jgi:CelD/BcsL family acetyltransferase involved in cellulose biosynthesis
VLEALWRALCAGAADAVIFHHLKKDSPLLKALSNRSTWWVKKPSSWSQHWSLEVPREVDGLQKAMKSKHRNWLARKNRELDAAFRGSVQWMWVRAFDQIDIDALCGQLEAVAAQTYQRGLGAGFRNDEEHRRRFRLLADQSALRLELLLIDGAVRAFWLGNLFGGTFYSWATAYDPTLRQYEPGNLLFHRMINELTSEGVSKLDFGLGDAFYKQRYGDMSWAEGTATLFAPTLKGALLHGSSTVTAGAERAARRLLAVTGSVDWLKTRWRSRLERRSPASASKIELRSGPAARSVDGLDRRLRDRQEITSQKQRCDSKPAQLNDAR